MSTEDNNEYKVKREDIIEQIEIQEEMQSHKINLVTCGNCGSVLLHRIKDDGDIKCPFCGYESDPCDFPDYFYSGMENNTVF